MLKILCPICRGEMVDRERRIDGNDICINRHTYPSADAIVVDYGVAPMPKRLQMLKMLCPLCNGRATSYEKRDGFSVCINEHIFLSTDGIIVADNDPPVSNFPKSPVDEIYSSVWGVPQNDRTNPLSKSFREAVVKCAMDGCHETGDKESFVQFCVEIIEDWMRNDAPKKDK